MKLAGKVAIVTGGTSGMGRGIAMYFAYEGAAVVVGGRDPERGAEVVASIEREGGKAIFVSGDISTYEDNEVLVRTAVETFGGLHIVVSNAGILGTGSVTTVPLETWHRTIGTNLHAVFYILRAAIPEMQKSGGGSVVVNGSIVGYKGDPEHPAYCASKGALIPLVKQVAMDYGPSIRINLLASGPVDTPLLQKTLNSLPNPEQVRIAVAEHLPLKRIGKPEDIASAALFLASDDSSWITGSALTVDGGSLCGG